MLQVSGNALQQVEKFKYLEVIFTSDGRWSEEVDVRIANANAILRELYRSVVTKQELSNTAKLSVFKSVFLPILSYGPESWVMTERTLSQGQAVEMRFLRRIHGVTLCDKVRSCEILRALNVEPLLRIERSQICWFSHVSEMPPRRTGESSWLNPPVSGPDHPRPRWRDYISDLTWSRLGVEPAELQYLKLLLTVAYSKTPWGCCNRDNKFLRRLEVINMNVETARNDFPIIHDIFRRK